MMMPNAMCKPPNPAARHQVPHGAGQNSVTIPISMKQSPRTGTMRTEYVPALTTPAPYSSSHVPGIAATSPAWKSTMVSSAPAHMAGAKLSAKRRPGPESSGICTARALRHGAGLQRGHHRGAERGAPHGQETPPGDGREPRGALHGVADIAQVIHRPRVQRRRVDSRLAERAWGDHTAIIEPGVHAV